MNELNHKMLTPPIKIENLFRFIMHIYTYLNCMYACMHAYIHACMHTFRYILKKTKAKVKG